MPPTRKKIVHRKIARRVEKSARRTREACDRGRVDGADGGRARESTSDAPRLMMGRGEWGQGTHKGARGGLTVPAPAVGLWTRSQASQSIGAGAPRRGSSAPSRRKVKESGVWPSSNRYSKFETALTAILKTTTRTRRRQHCRVVACETVQAPGSLVCPSWRLYRVPSLSLIHI